MSDSGRIKPAWLAESLPEPVRIAENSVLKLKFLRRARLAVEAPVTAAVPLTSFGESGIRARSQGGWVDRFGYLHPRGIHHRSPAGRAAINDRYEGYEGLVTPDEAFV